MPLYMYQVAYTAESLAAQIKEPRDRLEVTRPAFEAVGARIIVGGYSFGEYDLVVVYEAPDDVSAAAVALLGGSSGTLKSAKTTKLLGGAEWIQGLRKAESASPAYRPAR